MAKVYDDEKQISDDDLHNITGIPKGQSSDDDAFEQIKAGYGDTASHPLGRREGSGVSESDARAAKNRRAGTARRQADRQNMDRTASSTAGGGSLADKESAATEQQAGGGAKLGGTTLTPEQTQKLEDDLGLYTHEGQKAMRGLTLFQKHRKGMITGGVGGGVAMVIISIIFFIFPNFRIPSAMSLISNIVGEAAEEVVENRAQRMIISYLIQRAGGNPDNYVIQGSLMDTLWSTFRTGRLEDKIKRETGLEIERVGDGRIRLVHDGRPLEEINCRGVGPKRCTDTVIELSYKDNLAAEDMRKIVRLVVPAWRFQKASKFAKYLKIKYGVRRFGTPKFNDAESEEKNLQALRTQQVDAVLDTTLPVVDDAIACTAEDKQCNRFNENNEPIDTSIPSGGEGHKAASKEVSGDIKDAAQNGGKDVVQSGGSLVDRITERLLEKLVGKGTAKVATKAIPVIGWIDFASMLNHMVITAATNQVAARIPAILASTASAAMYAQWQGYGDEIKANRMNALYVAALTTQLNGSGKLSSPDAASYRFASGQDPAEGIAVETKINDNLKSPRDELMSDILGKKRYVDPLEWWYYTVGFLFRGLDDFTSWVISPLTSFAIDKFSALMALVFGEDWQKVLMGTLIDGLLKLLGLSIDPLATGAKLFNQLYAGADVAYNAYCRTNLGCRAMSQVYDRDFLWTPIQFGGGGISPDERLDMAALPLSQRLFSLDAPYSLANETIRAMPTTNTDWVGGIFGQIASAPSKLVGTITGKTYALSATPEQKAAIAGVRQYGATTQDLDQDTATQVRQQPKPECPANDPEKFFNHCQADKEVAGSLLCVYADCDEFQSGELNRPPEDWNLLANLEQLWASGNATAAVRGW